MVKRVTKKAPGRGYLDGQFLIAMPGMQDTRFSRTVVYICAHSSDGAMGIMVNQPAPQITFRDLLVQLNIIPEGPEIRLPDAAGQHAGPSRRAGRNRSRLRPPQRRLLHRELDAADRRAYLPDRDARDPQGDRRRQRPARTRCSRSATPAGRRASSRSEIQANGWLNCHATPELIFDPDLEHKYDRALATIGIDPARLSSEAGHA